MFNEEITVEEIRSSVETLDKDLRNAASTMTDDEARFLVDSYYQMQGNRIRSNNQIRQMKDEPHDILYWLSTQSTVLEKNVKAALNVYSNAHPIGSRIRTVVGIGEVIASGLVAHIDITRAPTAGAIWRFAGLDPTAEWKKGTKRPFNAELKVLCWKLGESFVKVSGNKKAFYGKIYKERKELEIKRNDNGEFADQAKSALEKKNIKKTTDAYKAYIKGKLPPAHIQARSTRYAVKLFLSHLHEVWYKHEFGKNPPNPFVLEHGGHAHKIEPPF
jgi:hypothetical protein|tara:strand:- start:4823 stop:5644 length:822 start_codon:yes stop_codon:yes gene_type:complete